MLHWYREMKLALRKPKALVASRLHLTPRRSAAAAEGAPPAPLPPAAAFSYRDASSLSPCRFETVARVLMDPASGEPEAPRPQLSSLSLPIFVEGVSLVLSRWTALQMAVEDGWGGKDSRRKSYELESAIVSWFTQSNDTLYIDDLENMLDESMILSFNTDIEDDSVEEVAEQLMIIHEECLQGNYASIEKLRTSKPQVHAVSQSRRVINDDEDESSDGDADASDMMVDETKPKATTVDKPRPREVPDEDGWTVVSSKRERGKRSG